MGRDPSAVSRKSSIMAERPGGTPGRTGETPDFGELSRAVPHHKMQTVWLSTLAEGEAEGAFRSPGDAP
jgi:hypothetical protein